MNITIHPYKEKYRDAVREISYETAYKGSSANKIFTDRELFADLWTNYYLDYEPHWAWVAKYKNKVVGYIVSSVNSSQYKKKMISRIIPKAVIGAIFRGTLWQKNNWWLLKAVLKTYQKRKSYKKVFLEKYPSHFHINVIKGYRSKHIGSCLVGYFLNQMEIQKIKGVYVSVYKDNFAAQRFFKEFKFLPLGQKLIFFPYENKYLIKRKLILYGREI
ncbi:MAG: GNAT family N-acetyltransferase [Promethearchaeota archaeon]